MSTASFSPPAQRARRRSSRWLSLRRMAAWLVSSATDRYEAPALVIGFATAHAVLWTFILINLKAAQDVHMDVAEAFAWGQKFQLGYGKHPPLSGWVAGIWFKLFPIADWSTYALAMTTVAVGMVISWLIALRVVDYRRAFFVVVMLAIYPIFNFKGFKYNPDLLQLVTLPLLVLAYLNAFEKRNVRAGVWLGLAGALALMTKYWVLTMIGAIGLAALVHPDRLKFLRSPAPWVAMAVAVVALIPHLIWLKDVDFVPLTNAGVNASQALNIWIIQLVVAIGPPLGALVFKVYMKTDWGISLFFLTPLALIAIPTLRLPGIALFRLTAIWLVLTLATLAASPYIALREVTDHRTTSASYTARSQLARQLTQMWHERFNSRWAVVAGTTEIGEPMTFYSPDHPAPFTPGEVWASGLTSLEEAKRLGFIGICQTTDPQLALCENWMKDNAPNAERLVMTTQRFFEGYPGPAIEWKIYIQPPAK